jgi:N-acetylglutamate synthase-like GNAT family acetyltransferase
MFYQGALIPKRSTDSLEIYEVTTSHQFEEFAHILTKCFHQDYGDAIHREFNQFQVHKRVTHLLASIDNRVVGIGSLYSSMGFGVIHNMGTLPEYRQHGVATAIMSRLATIASESNCHLLYLQCVGESAMEEFYAKLGFVTKLRRWGYVLG